MKMFHALLFVLCFFFVFAKRSSEIPDDLSPFNGEVSKNYGNSWIAGPNDKQYQFHIGVQSWITAREFCLTQESDLLTITTPEELKWVLSHYSPEIKSHKERLIQIGAILDDSHGMREWKWLNGEDLNPVLTPWKSGEPFDHLNGRERCATLSVQSKKLDDVDCDAIGSPVNMYRFVCERTNVIHEMHEINNNPLWRKVEDVLQYFGFGQTMNTMMKTLVSDEEDYWEEAKKEDAKVDKKKKMEQGKTEIAEEKKEQSEQGPETASEFVDAETTETSETGSSSSIDPQGVESNEPSSTTPAFVEITETASATVVDTVTDTTVADFANGTDNAQHDENPVQQKTISDDDITANLLSLSEKKKSEELVAVDDPQNGSVVEVFETATPEADIVRTTKAESPSGKTGTLDDKIQNIETIIHTVEKMIGNNSDSSVNVPELIEQVRDIDATSPSKSHDVIGAKKEEHFLGHCDEDEKKQPTTDEKIEDFLSTLSTFLARNKLKDLNKIANAKNTNKTLIERLKEAVQDSKEQKRVGKKAEIKKHSHSNEIEGELQIVLTDSITENITNSSVEVHDASSKSVSSATEEKRTEADSSSTEIHPKSSISKEVQVDDPQPHQDNAAFPDASKIDPKNLPVESAESIKQRKELQNKTDAAYKQFSERLNTKKLIERIKQNETARKRISADRVEILAAPAPTAHHNVNAFVEMEKLFSDIGKNFKRFLATRV